MRRAEACRNKWWALLGICLLAFTAFLDATIVNTALPFIQAALKISVLELQWIANIFTIVLSMTMIAIGKMADLWGRKTVFYYGVVIFGLSALGAGFSTTLWPLVFFRGLQSLGASTIFVASASLLTHVFPEKQRLKAISIYGAATGFGLMIGPFLGGVLVAALGWRWVFWINIPLIAIGLAACSFSLKEKENRHAVNIDWPGIFLLILGLGSLMVGIVYGAQENWSSIAAWALIGFGAAALIFLIVLDHVRKNPLLDLHIFKKNLITLAALSCALAGVASTVFMFFDPLYLRIQRSLSPLEIGLIIAVIPAAQALISMVFDRFVKLFGIANLLFASVIAAFLAVFLHGIITETIAIAYLILPFFLLGINWGLSNSATIAAVNSAIAPREIASAIGTIFTLWNVVGSLILAASTAVFHAGEGTAAFFPGFHGAVIFNIVFACLVLMASILIRLKMFKKN